MAERTTSGPSESVQREPELEDYPGKLRIRLPDVDWAKIADPATIRGLVAAIAGIVLLSWGVSRSHIADVVGVTLIVVAIAEAMRRYRGEQAWTSRLTSVVFLFVGVALLVWPAITGLALGLVLASLLAVSGLIDVFRIIRARRTRTWDVLSAALKIVLGTVIFIAGEAIIVVVVIGVAIVWIAAGFFTLITNIRADTDEEVRVTDAGERFLRWLELREYSREDRLNLYEKLFYEGPATRRRVSRFFTLMGFASAIATYGIVQDSTAVVIGAMLIAPLMTPLMGTAAALIMGWPRRAERSALVALTGVAFAIGLAYVLATTVPALINVETNSQILSRVNPNLVDLLIALAAGGAGAFALSRPDVSDALPGVAIAIALVPPLSVVGITLEQRAFDEALGAWLLFTTNMVAILVAGGAVFLITGFTPLRRVLEQRDWISRMFATVGILALIVFGVLAASSEQLSLSFTSQAAIQDVVVAWDEGQEGLDVRSVEISGSTIEIATSGESEPIGVDQLAADLANASKHEVEVVVTYFPAEVFSEEASPP